MAAMMKISATISLWAFFFTLEITKLIILFFKTITKLGRKKMKCK